MWTWDSGEITHDQACWTYDGYNGCEEPGTLLGSGGGPGHYDEVIRRLEAEQIKQEDDDFVALLCSMVKEGLL